MKRCFAEISASQLNQRRETKVLRPADESTASPSKRPVNKSLVHAIFRRSIGSAVRPPAQSLLESCQICSRPDDVKELLHEDSHCIPFAVSCANSCSLTAIADESGFVRVFDHASAVSQKPDLFQHHAHMNAIFDVRWSADDTILATASGDRTVSLIDVQTQSTRGILQAHHSSVKQVVFNPNNSHLLASGGRDGVIALWDTRVPTTSTYSEDVEPMKPDSHKFYKPVAQISFAHGYTASSSQMRNKTNHPAVSITSLLYKRDGTIVSASAGNPVLKTWDIRYLSSPQGGMPFLPAGEAVPSLRAAQEKLQAGSSQEHFRRVGSRPYGVSALVLSSDESQIFSVNRDSKIYVYPSSHPNARPSSVISVPELKVKTFYCKAAISRDASDLLIVGNSTGSPVIIDVRRAISKSPSGHVDSRSDNSSSQSDQENIEAAGVARADINAKPLKTRSQDYWKQFQGGHRLECTGVSVSHDSTAFVSISDDSFARVWRRQEGSSKFSPEKNLAWAYLE